MLENLKQCKIALLMGLFPDESYDNILNNSKGVIQYAADALQKSILKGLSSNIGVENLHIINLPYVGSFPSYYKTPFITKHSISFENCHIGYNYGFINLQGYKNFSRYYQAKKAIHDWYEQYDGEYKVIIVYALHTPFLQACVDLKHKFNDLRIIQIVPDLPQYMGGKDDFLHALNNKLLNRLYGHIDGWVLLSEHMKELLPINNNYTVVEGIYSDIDCYSESLELNSQEPIFKILYAGTLAKRYGIMNLVKAVHSLQIENIELNICGNGDSRNEIEAYQKIDNRIRYIGQLPRAEILKMLKASNLLVNPRTPEGEYTKYSFPSKTMEYLASGVPTLLYKLPGIPNEYYEYCFSIDQLGIEDLASKIQSIYHTKREDLKQLGINAKEFIYQYKNPHVQVQKIISLIYSIL